MRPLTSSPGPTAVPFLSLTPSFILPLFIGGTGGHWRSVPPDRASLFHHHDSSPRLSYGLTMDLRSLGPVRGANDQSLRGACSSSGMIEGHGPIPSRSSVTLKPIRSPPFTTHQRLAHHHQLVPSRVWRVVGGEKEGPSPGNRQHDHQHDRQ